LNLVCSWLSLLVNSMPNRAPFRQFPPLAFGHRVALVLVGLVGCLGVTLLASAEDTPRSKFNREVAVGDPAPEFEGLLGIDGRRHSLSDYRETPVLVVVFLRNLCPTTHQYEARLRNFAQEYGTNKVQLVAISVSRNPAEGLDRMAVRAKDKMYRWPYLIDESQFTGRQYGATVTPQFFVLDQARKIAYMGAFDDDLKGTAVQRQYVADAVRNLLEGKPVSPVDTLAKGCEIEYAK
jgi:peroxiredoxin